MSVAEGQEGNFYSISADAEKKLVRRLGLMSAILGTMTIGVFTALFSAGEKTGELITVVEYNGQAILRVEREVNQIREIVVDPIDGRLRDVETLMASLQRAIDEGWLPRAQEEISALRAEIESLKNKVNGRGVK